MRRVLVMTLGALACAGAGGAWGYASGPRLVAPLADASAEAIAAAGGSGVTARFTVGRLATRHPLLSGGDSLEKDRREAVARAVAATDGVGGVRWADSGRQAGSDPLAADPLHCQEKVEGLLESRSFRFAEGSAALLPESAVLLDEVAAALRPCGGAIVAINGHTDRSGREADNLALSMERARAVREALVTRGLERRGLFARGRGSAEPVSGLAPVDPANRRIEFAVIRQDPLHPTPVDTPGPY